VLDGDDLPTEPRAARDLASAIPDGSNLIVASSMPVRDLDWFMDTRSGIDIYGNRGASGIDGFVSTAFGVALATRGPTYALAGDLSVLHDQNGLIGAVDRDVDLTFVVLNNDGGGIFSFLPQAGFPHHFETLFGTPHGIDFERLAAMHGIAYERVDRASQLVEAIGPEGVRLIEVRTEREENVEVHRRAWAAVETALT
jgi:2-succinyl-5-enolpyruvyl-6-hydroxy-3-cyclohexene-1-carboxylate synthase